MKKINSVLLIDDDSTTNVIHKKLIENLKVSDDIRIAVNGEQALNILQNYIELNNHRSPELILLDLQMPFMNGFEFLEYYKLKNFSNKNEVKVIVLSNSDPAHDQKLLGKYRLANMHVMQKPLTEEKLKSALEANEEFAEVKA